MLACWMMSSHDAVQIPVDIWEGITQEQARQMADNLEFKGAALEEVIAVLPVHPHTHALQMVPWAISGCFF